MGFSHQFNFILPPCASSIFPNLPFFSPIVSSSLCHIAKQTPLLSDFECGHELGKIGHSFWVSSHQPEHFMRSFFLQARLRWRWICHHRVDYLEIFFLQILKTVTLKNVLPLETLVCPQTPDMDSTVFKYTSNYEMVPITQTYNFSSVDA